MDALGRLGRLERISFNMFKMVMELHLIDGHVNRFVTALDNAATPADVKQSCVDFLAAYQKQNTELTPLIVSITQDFASMAED